MEVERCLWWPLEGARLQKLIAFFLVVVVVLLNLTCLIKHQITGWILTRFGRGMGMLM